MELYIDSADLTEIEEASKLGVISGVTTNPSLLAKKGHGNVQSVIQKICSLIPEGPVSMECLGTTAEEMIEEGKQFATWAPNVYVKVPFCIEGIKAVKWFSANAIKTNVTLVFSVNQALLAANAGATFISAFVGRLDDIGQDGIAVVKDIVDFIDCHGFSSQVLAASIRHPLHVAQAAAVSAHIATVPYKIIQQLYHHPLTVSGIQQFNSDWQTFTKQ
ncbi:MAG: fructose-6-phosphate aldolase [Cyanobacteria bacterium P01_H01_bin.74]